MSKHKGFKKNELNVIASARAGSQEEIRVSLYPHIVKVANEHTIKCFVIDTLMSYTHCRVNDEVEEWLENNLQGQYQLSGGRNAIVAFENEAALAFFRLSFACKPYGNLITCNNEVWALA